MKLQKNWLVCRVALIFCFCLLTLSACGKATVFEEVEDVIIKTESGRGISTVKIRPRYGNVKVFLKERGINFTGGPEGYSSTRVYRDESDDTLFFIKGYFGIVFMEDASITLTIRPKLRNDNERTDTRQDQVIFFPAVKK